MPVAIEQDLVWYRDPRTGGARSIVSHGEPFTGREPSLENHFFAKVRPILDTALHDGRRETWPVVVLNLDFKTTEPEHLRAIWDLLGRYERWLCTAERTANAAIVAPMHPGPLLVLTGSSDEQEQIFHDRVPIAKRLRVFGAVHSVAAQAPGSRTNYRRRWNNPWSMVEGVDPPQAGDWTLDEEARLRHLVRLAHSGDLWIRFYTLNGHEPADMAGGWSPEYNFGSRAAVQQRWEAAIRAGVDFIAADQYEEFVESLRRSTTGFASVDRR